MRVGEGVHPPGPTQLTRGSGFTRTEGSDVVATPCPVLAMNVGDTDIDSEVVQRAQSQSQRPGRQ